jgi:hypothetical protein
MKTALLILLVFAVLTGCPWLTAVRTVVDIADELCLATLDDPKLDPELQRLLAGRTARQACNDAATARIFVDQVKSGQRRALGSLRLKERPTQ